MRDPKCGGFKSYTVAIYSYIPIFLDGIRISQILIRTV